jgi:hypothetical protein
MDQPGLVGHVRFLKGEGGLRHAALTEVREQITLWPDRRSRYFSARAFEGE